MAITFSKNELATLKDILDSHLEGMQDAREVMIQDDATLATFDDFVHTMREHAVLTERAMLLREKVEHELSIQ